MADGWVGGERGAMRRESREWVRPVWFGRVFWRRNNAINASAVAMWDRGARRATCEARPGQIPPKTPRGEARQSAADHLLRGAPNVKQNMKMARPPVKVALVALMICAKARAGGRGQKQEGKLAAPPAAVRLAPPLPPRR